MYNLSDKIIFEDELIVLDRRPVLLSITTNDEIVFAEYIKSNENKSISITLKDSMHFNEGPIRPDGNTNLVFTLQVGLKDTLIFVEGPERNNDFIFVWEGSINDTLIFSESVNNKIANTIFFNEVINFSEFISNKETDLIRISESINFNESINLKETDLVRINDVINFNEVLISREVDSVGINDPLSFSEGPIGNNISISMWNVNVVDSINFIENTIKV